LVTFVVKFAGCDGFSGDNKCESQQVKYLGRLYSFHSL